MRSLVLLLVAATSVNANWLRWSGKRTPVWTPRETGYMTEEDQPVGFTPKPTPAPGAKSDGERMMELFRRASTTSWANSETCGWYSGVSSYPLVCDTTESCVTNSANIVACASGTSSPFFAVCFDYSAYQGGQCNSIGSLTGCCQESQYGACVTYVWTGSPARSMFGCYTSATIISVLDEPQYVIDASRSSTASRSSGDGAITATTEIGTRVPGTQTTGSSSSGSGSGSSSSSHIGTIVGGVIGGVGGVALIVGIAAYLIRQHRQKKYNAVPMADQNGVQLQPQHQFPPSGAGSHMSYASSVATTANSYPPGVVPDPQHSYVQPYDPHMSQQIYDPSKQGVYGGGYSAGNLYPGSVAAGTPGVSPPRSPNFVDHRHLQSAGIPQGPMSYGPVEIDGTSAAEHASNPVEMASTPHH